MVTVSPRNFGVANNIAPDSKTIKAPIPPPINSNEGGKSLCSKGVGPIAPVYKIAVVPNNDSGKETLHAKTKAANLKGVRKPSNNARYKTIAIPKTAPGISQSSWKRAEITAEPRPTAVSPRAELIAD